MKIISTLVHGYLDYIAGTTLVLLPWIAGFSNGGAETLIPMVAGLLIIFYSLFTDYEAGAAKIITMREHLQMDYVISILLIISPFLFSFSKEVWEPHVIAGVVWFGVTALSQAYPVMWKAGYGTSE